MSRLLPGVQHLINPIQNKAQSDKRGKKPVVMDDAFLQKKATMASLLFVTETELLTFFFHLSIDLQEVTLPLSLYLPPSVPTPLPLQCADYIYAFITRLYFPSQS